MTIIQATRYKIQPVWPLCFTTNTAWSRVILSKAWSPYSVTLEISTDWNTWSNYSFSTYITLANIWDKVYFRNTSETDTSFSKNSSSYYQFGMDSGISASWDITSLLNKNGTTNLSDTCFAWLFRWTSLITPPKLPATTLSTFCYQEMFYACTSLTKLPELPATNLPAGCYKQMFQQCSNIKLSETQTWVYQTEYRIPITWTGSGAWTSTNAWNYRMFYQTWWTFTWDPTINTTYYTSNNIV
jgi:hypothetical protein